MAFGEWIPCCEGAPLCALRQPDARDGHPYDSRDRRPCPWKAPASGPSGEGCLYGADPDFGTPYDYLALLLWGFGVQEGVKLALPKAIGRQLGMSKGGEEK